METTVVIPNYNGIKYLDACMKSLAIAYERKAFEIIIVDNGSVDGSYELACTYARSEHISVVRFEENLGFCGAVNAGIKEATTPYVLLLNNDTTIDENFVIQLEKSIGQNSNTFAVSSKMLSMNEKDVIDDCGDLYCALGWAFSIGKGQKSIKHNTRKKVFAVCAGAGIYQRKVLEKIGLFDENHFAYLEDVDISYRARIHGYENFYCPEAIVYHAGSGFSGSRYNKFKIDLSAKNSIYIIYKNMPILQLLLNLPFLLLGFFIKFCFFAVKGYGKIYLHGLYKGFKLSMSREGKQHKVHYKPEFLLNFFQIQLELWWNILRKIVYF